MGGIEPDLVEPRRSQLDQIYAGETPEEHAERMERYESALSYYDIRIEEFMQNLKTSARDERAQAEEISRKQEAAEGEQLLTQIAAI